jgi:hypothetical protein
MQARITILLRLTPSAHILPVQYVVADLMNLEQPTHIAWARHSGSMHMTSSPPLPDRQTHIPLLMYAAPEPRLSSASDSSDLCFLLELNKAMTPVDDLEVRTYLQTRRDYPSYIKSDE